MCDGCTKWYGKEEEEKPESNGNYSIYILSQFIRQTLVQESLEANHRTDSQATISFSRCTLTAYYRTRILVDEMTSVVEDKAEAAGLTE